MSNTVYDNGFGSYPDDEIMTSMINREIFDQEIKKFMDLYKTPLDEKTLDRFYLGLCEYLSGSDFLRAAKIIYYSGIPRPEGYFPCVMDFVDLA